MKRRLFVPLIVAGMAAASGVASADPAYWRANGLLLEVSADPRDGTDLVRVDATRADELELIALNDTVTLRGMTLHFADGNSLVRPMGFVRPGQPVMVNLPHNCAPITAVELDYGDPALRRYDRTPARLQIVPRMTGSQHGYEQPAYGYQQPAYGYQQPAYGYQQPAYGYQQPAYGYQQPRVRPSRYTIQRPRQSTWSVQGSFRF